MATTKHLDPVQPSDLMLTAEKSSLLVPTRLEKAELLDLGVGSLEDVKQNFDDMWRINRWLGGFRALTTHLYPRLLKHSSCVSILDIGTGSGHIPAAIVRWTQYRRDIRIFALDMASRNLAIARQNLNDYPNEITLLQADGLHLPFEEKSVDYVISSLFLHHLSAEQVLKLLRQAFRIARHGIIMTDLVRGWLPFIGFKFSQPMFARSYLTAYDGAISIRRAYTPSELLTLAEAAGLPQGKVHQHFPWRMTLVADHV